MSAFTSVFQLQSPPEEHQQVTPIGGKIKATWRKTAPKEPALPRKNSDCVGLKLIFTVYCSKHNQEQIHKNVQELNVSWKSVRAVHKREEKKSSPCPPSVSSVDSYICCKAPCSNVGGSLLLYNTGSLLLLREWFLDALV